MDPSPASPPLLLMEVMPQGGWGWWVGWIASRVQVAGGRALTCWVIMSCFQTDSNRSCRHPCGDQHVNCFPPAHLPSFSPGLPVTVLSRRTFPPPRTLGMVEPGYRDAPAADEPVAFVYVKVGWWWQGRVRQLRAHCSCSINCWLSLIPHLLPRPCPNAAASDGAASTACIGLSLACRSASPWRCRMRSRSSPRSATTQSSGGWVGVKWLHRVPCNLE